MSEVSSPSYNADLNPGGLVNLHEIPALQEVRVSESVHLRPLAEDDGPAIRATLQADPEIARRVFVADELHDQDGLINQLAKIKADTGLIRYVINDDSDKFLGLVSFWRDDGFMGQPPVKDAYGFGYFLDPAARGQGLVHDSVERLMEVAQSQFPVSEFQAYCEDDNPASIAVLEGLGFKATDQLLTSDEDKQGRSERKYVKPIGNHE